jgi:hypothetical protein
MCNEDAWSVGKKFTISILKTSANVRTSPPLPSHKQDSVHACYTVWCQQMWSMLGFLTSAHLGNGTTSISNVEEPTRWTLITKTITKWCSAEDNYSLPFHKPPWEGGEVWYYSHSQTFVFHRHKSQSMWTEKSINKYEWGSNSKLRSLVPYPKTSRFPHSEKHTQNEEVWCFPKTSAAGTVVGKTL